MIFNIIDRRSNQYSFWVEGILEPSCHDNYHAKLNIPDDNTWTIMTYRHITIPMLLEIAHNQDILVTVFLYDAFVKDEDEDTV